MPDLIQGGVDIQPSNVPEGQGGESQQPSNEQSQAPVVQSQDPSNPQGGGSQPDLVAQLRGLQAAIDRVQVQQMQFQQTQLQQPQQVQAPQNPYDPATQGQDYWRWEMKSLSENTARQTRQELLGVIEQASTRQQEIQWQAAHPEISIDLVKQFGQMNGINNLDHALTIMRLPQTMTNVQNQSFGNALNQFQRPQNQAVPVRGGQGASTPESQGSFQQDMEAFAKTNGRVYQTWPKERQVAFDMEWKRREDSRGAGQR